MTPLSLDQVVFFGKGLERPECVLTTAKGEVFTCDRRGGIACVQEGADPILILGQDLPEGFLPNGFALMPDRSFLVANLGGAGGVWRLTPEGKLSPWLFEVDGQHLTNVNFIRLDDAHRIWITISTRMKPRELAFDRDVADGYIVFSDKSGSGSRIVADNLAFANELVLDSTCRWLHVNETMGRRLTRFKVSPDGSLGCRESVVEFNDGTFPDGLAYDSEGCLWVTSVVSNRLLRISPNGSQTVILEDTDPDLIKYVEKRFAQNRFGREDIDSGSRYLLKNISSLAFGGPDLKTVFLGSTHGDRLATFRSPVKGKTPVHWKF